MKSVPKPFIKFFYIISGMACILLILALLNTNWTMQNFSNLLVFGILAIASESLPVALPKGGYVSVTYAIFLSSVIMLPPGATLLVAALGGLLVLGKDALREPPWKRIFNASQFVISMAAAWLVINLNGNFNLEFSLGSFASYFASTLAYMIVNVTIVSIALGILNNKSPLAVLAGNIRWSIPNFLALTPLGLLMALIYTNYKITGLILLFIPLLIARHSFQLYMDMRKNYLNTVEALVQALEAKDSYTSGHSGRVAQLSVKLAEELKLPEDKVEFIKYAGVLHDVGKIGVSEAVLNKQGQLTKAEWETIRSHPSVGQNIIQNIDFLFDVGQVVRHHHERIDGKGYPDGLKGEEISLESRIIAIADTYDAMTSDRSYRKGKTPREALNELECVAGTQLDAQLVEVFCKITRHDLKLEEKSPTPELALS